MAMAALMAISAFLGAAFMFIVDGRLKIGVGDKIQLVSNSAQALSFVAAMIAIVVTLRLAQEQSQNQTRQYTREFLNSQLAQAKRSDAVEAADRLFSLSLMSSVYNPKGSNDRASLRDTGTEVKLADVPAAVEKNLYILLDQYLDVHRYVSQVSECVDQAACDKPISLDTMCSFINHIRWASAEMEKGSPTFGKIFDKIKKNADYYDGQFSDKLKYMTSDWKVKCAPMELIFKGKVSYIQLETP